MTSRYTVVRTQALDSSRHHLVTLFVRGHFSPRGINVQMPLLESISHDELVAVILEALEEHGCFPFHAEVIHLDPSMYIGEQIRTLKDGSYLVANCESYEYAPKNGTSSRIFANPQESVACFLRVQLGSYMRGIPVT